MGELEQLFRHLKQPEYFHVVLNPIPIYGMAVGVTALGLALLTRSRAAKLIGLGLVFLAGVSAWPTVQSGHAGYDRVYAMSNLEAQQWLDLHAARGQRVLYAGIGAALLAAVAVIGEFKARRWATPVGWATVLAAMLSLGLAGWAGHAGGQVRHSEFRDGPPPRAVPQHHHGDDSHPH